MTYFYHLVISDILNNLAIIELVNFCEHEKFSDSSYWEPQIMTIKSGTVQQNIWLSALVDYSIRIWNQPGKLSLEGFERLRETFPLSIPGSSSSSQLHQAPPAAVAADSPSAADRCFILSDNLALLFVASGHPGGNWFKVVKEGEKWQKEGGRVNSWSAVWHNMKKSNNQRQPRCLWEDRDGGPDLPHPPPLLPPPPLLWGDRAGGWAGGRMRGQPGLL